MASSHPAESSPTPAGPPQALSPAGGTFQQSPDAGESQFHPAVESFSIATPEGSTAGSTFSQPSNEHFDRFRNVENTSFCTIQTLNRGER